MCSWAFCFVKQKTADEMRISDWSSDVCSSDLATLQSMLRRFEGSIGGYFALPERVAPSTFRSRCGKESLAVATPGTAPPVSGLSTCSAPAERADHIGSASCRGRVRPTGELTVGAGSFKDTTNKNRRTYK